jgi:phosphotransferase system  glucose/maltose/N-acetylglucosamine-specific IIC component
MTRTRSTVNFPLIALWVVDIAIMAVGYVIMTTSDAGQAEFYNAGGADYTQYFPALSGSTLGGMLIAAGAFGVILTLAVQVLARSRALPAAAPDVAAADVEIDDELDAAASAYPEAPVAHDSAATDSTPETVPAAR